LDSKRINALSEEAELFYRRLMSVVDDYGRFEADPVLLRARCFARQLERWPVERIEKCLSDVGEPPSFDRRLRPLVVLYTVDGCNYLEIQDFQQRTRTESRFPRSNDGQMTASRARPTTHTSPTPTPTSERARDLVIVGSERFLEFWEAYPMKKNRDKCCHIWLSLVAPADEGKVFACLGRYLDSQLVADGKVQNPENWLHDCVRDGWATEWPPSAAARRRGASVRQQTASVEGQEESKRRALAAYDRADENERAELRNLWPELWPQRIEPHGEEKAEKAPSVRMQRMPR
jgi:hypothetical protein